jgi:hypothetical protein
MAATAWSVYDKAKLNAGKGIIVLGDSHVFKVALFLNTSNCGSDSVGDEIGDLTNESSGGGYTRQTMTSVTWAESGGTVTWDADDVEFTASGGSITARYAVIYDDTTTSPLDCIVAWTQLDSSDVVTTDGNKMTVQMHGSGIFTLT